MFWQAVGTSASPLPVSVGRGGEHLCRHHFAENPVAGLDVCGDGGLFTVQGMIVVQKRGGLDHRIGEVVGRGEPQLLQRAQHAAGQNAPELALFDLNAAGQQSLVLGHRHEVALVDVPGAGDDLDRLGLAHVNLADPHVVGVGMVLHPDDPACHHILNLRA